MKLNGIASIVLTIYYLAFGNSEYNIQNRFLEVFCIEWCCFIVKIRFEYLAFRHQDIKSADFDCLDEFKDFLGFLLDEVENVPYFDTVGITFFDDNESSVSEITMMRIESSDSNFDIVISLNIGDSSVRIARYHQSIFRFWHYLCEYLN